MEGLRAGVVVLCLVVLLFLGACNTSQPTGGVQPLAVNFPVLGVTSPGGILELGIGSNEQFWISDHLLGFCRLDNSAISQATCKTNAVSPGQASFIQTSSTGAGVVFVPDNSAKSRGIIKYSFTGTTVTGNTLLLAGPTSQRPTATAIIGNDLYVGNIKGGTIWRIPNAVSSPGAAVIMGATSDGAGVSGLAAIGNNLYLAEGSGVTVITNANSSSCAPSTPCTAELTSSTAAAPLSIAAVGTDLFIADADIAVHFDTLTDVEEEYASGFSFPTALLAVDSNPNNTADPHRFTLYVGDDPTDGAQVLQGYVDDLNFGDVASGGGGQPALTEGTKVAGGVTSPGGLVKMGPAWWIADHLFGFCRLDPGANGLLVVNQTVCFNTTLLASPGQPSFDPSTNFVYVPDNSSKGRGVYRIRWNPPTTPGGRGTLGAGTLIDLGGNRPTGTALIGNTLYISFLKRPGVAKLNNASTVPTSPGNNLVSSWVSSPDGKGIASLAIANDDANQPTLYAAAGTGVFKAPLGCNAGCALEATTINSLTPLALASDGNNTVFVADGVLGNLLLRYDVMADTTEILASRGNNSGTGNPERSFKFITGLGTALDNNAILHVYVADDPSDGAQVLQGAVWDVENQ